MRLKDQQKFESIVVSTIELVTKNGFDNVSIKKIAKRANVSPATIYIHFKNKNDLFEKIYIKIREEISTGTLTGINEIPEDDIERIFKLIWKNSFSYNLEHPEFLKYREKFEQTSLIENIRHIEIELQTFVKNLFHSGIENKIIKNLPIFMLITFAYVPIISLLKLHFTRDFIMDDFQIDTACNFAWKSIKL